MERHLSVAALGLCSYMPALQGTESSCGMGHLANPATTCMQALKSPFSSSIFTCGGAQTLAVQLPGMQGTQHHRQPSGGAMSPLAPGGILPCSLPSALLTQTRSLQPQHGCQNSSLCGSCQQHEQSVPSLAGSLGQPSHTKPRGPISPPQALTSHTPWQAQYTLSILLSHHCYLGVLGVSPPQVPPETNPFVLQEDGDVG